MHFGIMTLQLDALLPTGVPAQQVMGQMAAFDHAALVRQLFAQGFNPIELSGDLGMFLPASYSPPTIAKLAALKEELGVRYTVHLPLWSVEPSTPLTPVREGSVQALIDLVRATQPLAPEVYVLHATGALAAEFYRMALPPQARALLLRQFQQGALASLQRLLAETGVPSRKLAIETIEFPLDLTMELAEQLDLSICLDVGHILSGFSGTTDLDHVLDLLLPRLAEVHLHDAIRPVEPDTPIYGKDHVALGHGDLDVGRFLDRLTEGGFDGPVILELTVAEALASLQVIDTALS